MSVWEMLEWAAWIISAVIAIWLIADVIKVSREYDEEFLTSSIESLDDDRDSGEAR